MTDTYRIRISLLDSEPEIWRLVEMSSALSLPEVHDVLQITMGWRDSHLHTFRSADGRQWWDAASLQDELEGFDEESATLADVLTTASGPLRYDYDLGDGWEHEVELIEVITERPQVPVLIRGELRGPLEDSGGTTGYARVVAVLTDPEDEDHAFISDWVRSTLGPWHGAFDAESVDVVRVNQLLATRFGAPRTAPWGEHVIQLADRMRPGHREEFLAYLSSAPLDSPELDVVGTATSIEPYRWLLTRIGDDGIKLSAPGWMPPAVVAEAVRHLDWESRWPQSLHREDKFLPIQHLRASAVRLGLVRKSKGHLLLTATGKRLIDDAPGLWRHLAASWLDRTKPGAGRDAAVLFAVELLVGAHPEVVAMQESVAYGMDVLGWVGGEHQEPLTTGHVSGLLAETTQLGHALGVLTEDRQWRSFRSSGAHDFARIALGMRTS